MNYYTRLFKKNWKTMVAAAVTGTAAGSGCSAFIIFLIHRQLATDVPPEPYLAPLYVLTVVLYFVLSSYSEYLLVALSQTELHDLRMRFSRHVLSLPLKRIEEVGGADLMASLTEDVERIAVSLRRLTTVFLSGSMVLGAGMYVAWLSWRLFLVTVLLLSAGVYLYRLPLRKWGLLQRYWTRLRDGWDQLHRHFHALTHGTKELLVHRERREAFLALSLGETCARLRDDAIRGKTIQNLFFRAGDILYLVVLGFALFLLPSVMQIEQQILAGYVMAGLFVLAPISSLINFGPDFGEAVVALERLERLGVPMAEEVTAAEAGTAVISAEAGTVAAGGAALLRLEGVTFRYRREIDDEEFLLGPLTFDLHEGETTFIIGGNGSGKTTLLKLICGLYVPESGRILWRGEEVTDLNRESYRQFFSVVFSDFYLFDALFGLEGRPGGARTNDYLERLHLDKKVSVKEGRLSTVDLSQGQRKRLALLTAYLEDRPVYMFDEWAADQDPVFKEVFYSELLPELKARGKTLFVITHDDAWYDQADRAVKLRDGQVVAREALVPQAVGGSDVAEAP